MAQPVQKVFRSAPQRSFIKPSSPVCKRLFDFPDPFVTKCMLQEMENSESRRLEVMWNFDAKMLSGDETEAKNPAERSAAEPMSSKKPRYEWEFQNREKVPSFYTRPFHRHHSEARHLQNACRKPQPTRIAKLFQEVMDKPSPLRNRDENVSPGKPTPMRRVASNKRVPKFTSPPKNMSKELNTSFARLVPALRIPSPISPQIANPFPANPQMGSTLSSSTLPQEEHCHCVQNTCSSETENVRTSNQTQPESTPTLQSMTSKSSTSRQLFTSKTNKKRLAEERLSKQPKITDMIPQRKLRQNSSKRRRSSTQDTEFVSENQ